MYVHGRMALLYGPGSIWGSNRLTSWGLFLGIRFCMGGSCCKSEAQMWGNKQGKGRGGDQHSTHQAGLGLDCPPASQDAITM